MIDTKDILIEEKRIKTERNNLQWLNNLKEADKNLRLKTQ